MKKFCQTIEKRRELCYCYLDEKRTMCAICSVSKEDV